MRTIPLYLIALIVAIANTPLDIYQINAWNVGTLKVEPWRRQLAKAMPVRIVAFLTRIRAWFGASEHAPRMAVAVAVLMLAVFAMSVPTGVLLAVAPVATMESPLKLARTRQFELETSLAAKKKERAEVGVAAIREKRGMTDDENARFLALNTAVAEIEADIAKHAPLLQAAIEWNDSIRNAPTPDPTAEDQASLAAAAAAKIKMGEDLTTKAPGYFGRQLHAVRRAALAAKGGESLTSTDEQLLKPMRAVATGANTDVPSDGGFLVDQQRSSTIIQRAYELGQVLQRVDRMPIGAGFNGAKVPAIDETSRADNSRFGGIVSGWLGQGNTLSSGKPTFREIDLKLRKVGAFVYATDEMLVDAVLFDAWVNRNLPLELTFRTEDAVMNGVGGTQPLGVLNNPAVLTITRGGAGHIISDDLRGMWKRMWAGSRANAVWFYDQSIEEELDLLAIPIGTGGQLDPSFKPAGSMPGQQYPTYKGRPMIPVEYCANLGTSGDILCVNLDEYLLIDKGNVDQAVSLHVAFLTDEAVYRFIYRVDGQLKWNAALTPKSGGNMLSCAIVLS